MYFNRVLLIGRLGKDPDLSYSTAGKPIARSSLAVWRGKRNGTDQGTDWFDLSFFGKTAEAIVQYAKKGNLLHVEGSVRIQDYQTQDGQKRRSINVAVMSVKFLTPKDGNGGAEKPAPPAEPEAEPAQDDDVPF